MLAENTRPESFLEELARLRNTLNHDFEVVEFLPMRDTLFIHAVGS